jgi:hypothetical protein
MLVNCRVIIIIIYLTCVNYISYATNCTYPNFDNFDITGLNGYYKRFIINSPVTQFDSVSNDQFAFDASESIRMGLNAITVQNVTADYKTLYKTTWQLSVTNNNDSFIRQLETTSLFTVSGCLSSSIGNACRWTAPIVCAQSTNTNLLSKTSSYMQATKQNLICTPVLMEWENLGTYYANTTAEVVQSSFYHASNIKWKQILKEGAILTTPVSDIPSIYNTANSTLSASGRKGKTGALKYQPSIQQCTFGSKPYVYTVRDQQNLAQGGVSCFTTTVGTGIAIQSLLTNPTGSQCKNLTVALLLTEGIGQSTTGVSVAYPPVTQSFPANDKTQWRPITGLIPSNPSQDPIVNPQSGVQTQFAMILVGLCSNACSVNSIPSYCDSACYYVLDNLIKSNVANNLTIPLLVNECENLDYSGYNQQNILTQQNILVSCNVIVPSYNGKGSSLPAINPLTQPETNFELYLSQALIMQTTPTSFAFGGNPEYTRCEEILTANNDTVKRDYVFWSSTESNGQYTGAACGIGELLLRSTRTQAATLLMQQLFDRENTLPINVLPVILTDSDLITNWLQSLQNAIISIITSTAILAAGSQSGKIDSLFYTAMNVTTCFKSSIQSNYRVFAVWILNALLLTILSVTNVAAYANIIQQLLQYRHVNNYISTKVETVTIEGNSFVIESMQTTSYKPKLWPGLTILICYTIILVIMLVYQIVSMISTKWENRWLWLRENSWDTWREKQRTRLLARSDALNTVCV